MRINTLSMKHHCISIAIKIMIYKNNKLDVPKGTSLVRASGSLSQTVLGLAETENIPLHTLLSPIGLG